MQPTGADVAAHGVAEPRHTDESTRRREQRPPVLHGNRARVARRHLSDLGQRQVVFPSAFDLLQVVRDHVVSDLFPHGSPRNVVVGKRHLCRVAHVGRAAESTGGASVNLFCCGDLLPFNVAEKRAGRVVVLGVHDATQRVSRSKYVPHLMTRQRPTETGSQNPHAVACVQRVLVCNAQRPAGQAGPKPNRKRLPVGRLRPPALRPTRELAERLTVNVEWDVLVGRGVRRQYQLLHQQTNAQLIFVDRRHIGHQRQILTGYLGQIHSRVSPSGGLVERHNDRSHLQ